MGKISFVGFYRRPYERHKKGSADVSLKWLDRDLIVSPYSFALCLSEKQFKKELKRLNLPSEQWPPFLATPHASATVHFFERHGDIDFCAIVCLGDTSNVELEQVYSMLVHEAVHIWQEIRAHIGERDPSSEFEAYSIQAISQRLMFSYKEQTAAKEVKK